MPKEKFLIKKNIFRRTTEELKEFNKENNIKLLRLLEYLRRRNNKKVKRGKLIND